MKCPQCGTNNPSDSKYCKEFATSLQPFEEIPVSAATRVTMNC
jgi:hypothetical protein